MKKTITAVCLLLSISIYSQQSKVLKPKADTCGWKCHTAGYELIKSSKHFYTGFALTIAGAGVALMPVEDRQGTVIIGAVTSLIGAIFIAESHIHIKRAGVIMNRNGIGITMPISSK